MNPNGAAVAKWLQQKPDNSEEQSPTQLQTQRAGYLRLSTVFGRFLARSFDFIANHL
jgi:hypothetical protein